MSDTTDIPFEIEGQGYDVEGTLTVAAGGITSTSVTAITGTIIYNGGNHIAIDGLTSFNDSDNLLAITSNGGAGSTYNVDENGLAFTASDVDYNLSNVFADADALDTANTSANVTFTAPFQAAVCFCSGTRIKTTCGDINVEKLVVGDIAITASGAFRPIVWIGRNDIDCDLLGRSPKGYEAWPIRILADAFGPNVPSSTLFLSPGHPVSVGSADGEVLVPIMCLINGTTIARQVVPTLTYWHVELDAHDILLANDLPAESYLDYGNRIWFGNGMEHSLANPDFIVPGLDARCRPVAVEGPAVENERKRLDTRFAIMLKNHCAWPTRDNPSYL